MDSRKELPEKYQQTWIHDMILSMCKLIILFLECAETEEDHSEIRKIVWKFIHCSDTDQDDYRIIKLILNVSIKNMEFLVCQRNPIFWSMIKIFLDSGADVNAKDTFYGNRTPMHLALMELAEKYETVLKYQFLAEPLVKLFLDYGSHIDLPIIYRNILVKEFIEKSLTNINLMNYMSLKCFSAQVVCKYGIKYKGLLPANLYEFIECHR